MSAIWKHLVLALTLLFALPLLAQDSTPRLKVSTRLVVLDVVVIDKKGVPVLDLPKEAFKVYEGKDEQPIRSVEPPSAHELPSGNLVHSSADLGKIGNAPVNIMVLDELNTPFEDNAYTRYSAEKYLKAQPAIMAPTTLLATNNSHFLMLQDYTQDRNVLEAALKRDPVSYPWRLKRNGDSGPEAVIRFGQTLAMLEQIAQAAAGTPGRKNIIWVGRGFPSLDLTGASETVKPVTDAIRRCTDLLMASRVTLYVIDPSPLSSATYDTEGTAATAADLKDETGIEPFSDAVSFDPLAITTGGRVFAARNDVNAEIAESIRDGMNYYTIAYRPTSDEATGYRHVHVLIDRPGLVAHTRDGYYVRPAESTDAKDAKVEADGEVLDVASAALSKMVYNGVKVRAGKASENSYNLAIQDASLTWTPGEGDNLKAEVSLVAICFSSKGKVLSHVTQAKVLVSPHPNSREGIEEIVAMPLVVPPGTERIRFIVRDAPSKRLGSADLDAK